MLRRSHIPRLLEVHEHTPWRPYWKGYRKELQRVHKKVDAKRQVVAQHLRAGNVNPQGTWTRCRSEGWLIPKFVNSTASPGIMLLSYQISEEVEFLLKYKRLFSIRGAPATNPKKPSSKFGSFIIFRKCTLFLTSFCWPKPSISMFFF